MNPGDLVGSPPHEIHSYKEWTRRATYPSPTSFAVSPNSVGIYFENRINQHGDAYWFTLFNGHLGWVRDTWLAILE